MTQYKFLIGFVTGLAIGLIPPLIMMKMDSDKLNALSARMSSGSDNSSVVLPPPDKPANAVVAREIRAHDITDLHDAWKTVKPPASGTVLYVGPGKGVEVPGVTVGDDRVVVIFQASAADQQALAQAITAAGSAKP